MLSRRKILAAGAGALTSLALGQALAAGRQPVYGGWVKFDDATAEFLRTTARPYFSDQGKSIAGDGRNKQIVLVKHYERVTGKKFIPNLQEIGDCCGEAAVMGAQVLSAVQIDAQKKHEEYKGPFSVEFTYASSRVEVGGSRIRRGDGSTGAWVCESMRRLGLLRRDKYGQTDLTKYRPDLGRSWGRPGVGVPDELEKVAKDHPVKTVALVRSWEEACDSIANGFPVVICSSVGYVTRTDREGFLVRGRDPWYHAMLLGGIDTASRRQGGLVVNSWGTDWISGPQHALGTPAGCFWADARNIEAALLEGDSFAISNFTGFPRRNVDYLLY